MVIKEEKTEPIIENLLSYLFLSVTPIPSKFANRFQRIYENLTFGNQYGFCITHSVDNHVLLSRRHAINIIHYNFFAA